MFVLPLTDEEKEKYPQGKAFCAGYGPETKMLNLATWEWEHVSNLAFKMRRDGCAVLLPLKPPYYKPVVLHFGGSIKNGLKAIATDTAEIIDLQGKKPEWCPIHPAYESRVNGVALFLPDGKILAVGGNSTGRFEDPVHRAETFDPETMQWTHVAEQVIHRGYHSTALLLADGRVLSSGTTPLGKHELGMEVYYPAYFFKGGRPIIIEVDKKVTYNQEFRVKYEFSWDIQKAVLISPGSVTHAFDMNTRMVELEIIGNSKKTLVLKAPKDAHIAPPGFYMLFILSEHEVPSEAVFIQPLP
jgi:hypothetical protein